MDELTQIKGPITSEFEVFQSLFKKALNSDAPYLNKMLSHLQKGLGKQMRPILTLLTAKLFGEVSNPAQYSAIALELLHTASLVHDDVVDNSNKRRGEISLNALFSNKVSVLTGDFLLAESLSYAAQTEKTQIIKIIATLGSKLAKGELLEMQIAKSKIINEADYFKMISQKTAILFATAAQAGAIASNATKEEQEQIRCFGENLGICFQIKDDLFDLEENNQTGKPDSLDLKEGKITLPALYAFTHFKNEQTEKWLEKIKQQEITDKEIKQVSNYIKEVGGISYAEKKIQFYYQKAKKALELFPETPIKVSLINYLNYSIYRTL